MRIARDDRFELHLGQQLDRRVDQPQALGAQRDLLGRFLAGDVQRALGAAPIAAIACSSSVDLPMPGSPPSRTTPPGTQPAAQHAIELFDARGRARIVHAASTLAESTHRARRAGERLEARRGGRRDRLDQRVPGAAVRALALPLAALPAALRCRRTPVFGLAISATPAISPFSRARPGCTTAVPSLPTTMPRRLIGDAHRAAEIGARA